MALSRAVADMGMWPLPRLVRAFGSPAAKERLKNLDAHAPEELGVRPEVLLINRIVWAQAGVLNIGNALAFLALTWSTVVLLGGYISAVRIKEFWFLTVTTFVMASGLLKLLGSSDKKIGTDIDLPIGWIEMLLPEAVDSGDLPSRVGMGYVRFMCALMLMKNLLLFPVAILLALSPYGCIAVSLMRLIQHDYGDADGNAANKVKLEAALFLFYTLVLLQNLLVIYWLFLVDDCDERIKLVIHRCGFVGDQGRRLVSRYYEESKIEFEKNGDLSDGWNFITFAARLLESGSRDDYHYAVRLLDTLLTSNVPIRPVLLIPKRCAFQNLVMLLGWEGRDGREIRERAARIVAYVAGEVHISQFPGALQCISSLFDTSKLYCAPEVLRLSENFEEGHLHQQSDHETPQASEQSHHQEDSHLQVVISNQQDHQQGGNFTSDQLTNKGDNTRGNKSIFSSIFQRKKPKRSLRDKDCYSFESIGTKGLVLQGLVILERLTEDQGNCTEICSNEVMLSRIMRPLSFQGFLCAENDPIWLEILSTSLRVISRLINAPGDASARLRHVISLNNEAVGNLMGVLEDDEKYDQELHEQAIEILIELAFDETTSKMIGFVNKLQRIFVLYDEKVIRKSAEQRSGRDVTLRRKAGEALARLLFIQSARDSAVVLDNMFPGKESNHDLNSKEDVMIHLLTRVLDRITSSKTETVAEAETGASATDNSAAQNRNESSIQQSDEQLEGRKFLAVMLSLTVLICNKLIDKDDLTHVDIIDSELVQKLMNIVERNNSATADCLRVVKLTCQVVIAVIQAKSICVKYFNKNDFNKVLSEALITMSNLDYCMLFANNDRGITMPNRSLQSLVKEAQELFVKAQQSPGN